MYRKAIVVDRANVCGPDLSNFPVLVRLSDADIKSADHGGHAASPHGDDIFFASDDGHVPYAHEIESYDPATGELKAWVRIPKLSADADAVFCIFYGRNEPERGEAAHAVWDPGYKLVVHCADAALVPGPADFADAITVEAWVESDGFQAEALQSAVSKWRHSESFDRFEGYDASNTDGLDTRGFFGAVFDGRYVYYVPEYDGNDGHGRVLRFDTHGGFKDPARWSAYDAGNTDGLNTKGYYGAVFDGRYVFFVPRQDNRVPFAGNHTRMLRYDTHGDFKAAESWSAYDVGSDVTHQSGAFDGRYIYLCPGYKEKEPHCSGEVLRYDTWAGLKDPESYAIHDTAGIFGAETTSYDGAVFDGRYVYFAPLDIPGRMLRYDTHEDFRNRASWQTFNAAEVNGLNMGKCVGAIFDGRYVYYVPYAKSVVVRFDTNGDFSDANAWSAHDEEGTSGLLATGYDGAAFDGRYVYFIPFWNGKRGGRSGAEGLHGQMLRYDTQADFADPASWQAADAGRTDGVETVGFNGGAFDGRFLYCAPWRLDSTDDAPVNAHANALRYDTTGEGASFSLRCVDLGHNGGLCAAVPGPSFLVNTEKCVLNVRANRNLSPGRRHLAGVYDGRRITLFVDGLPVAERAGSGRIQNCAADVAIGKLQDGLGRFKGRVSEVRVSNIARSADWMATQYRNQSSPSIFCRVGEEEIV